MRLAIQVKLRNQFICQIRHPLPCFFPRLDVKRSDKDWMMAGGDWEARGAISTFEMRDSPRESTPTNNKAPQLTRLAIQGKLRATNQFSRCTSTLLVSFPMLINWMMTGGEWEARGAITTSEMRDSPVKNRKSFRQESQHPQKMRHHS